MLVEHAADRGMIVSFQKGGVDRVCNRLETAGRVGRDHNGAREHVDQSPDRPEDSGRL
ncbi:MAG: hypothetical protein AAF527_08980 [Pseudomonadota bacterium]